MNKRIPVIFGILMMCFAVWLLMTPNKSIRLLLDRLESIGYDFQLRAHVLGQGVKVDSPVAIIDIDDKSVKAVGRWPWPRRKIAELVDALRDQGAAVIAFDIFFSEKQDNVTDTVLNVLAKNNQSNPLVTTTLTTNAHLFDEDALLVKSLQSVQSVLSYTFIPRPETENALPPPMFTLSPEEIADLQMVREVGYISNLPAIQDAAKGAGFINIFPDDDGIVRRAPLLMEYHGDVYPAIALQAVLTYLGEDIQLYAPFYHNRMQLEGVQLGKHVIPTDARGMVLIPFIGRSYTFPYYSAIDTLNKTLPANALLGRIVFIGSSATGLGDLQPTSIQNPFPGVEMQATLANGMLTHHFSYKPAWTLGANVVITILFGLVAAFVFPSLGPRILGGIIIVFPLLLFFINNQIWSNTGLILSFLMPIILVQSSAIFNMLYGYIFETRRREQLKEMFGQYVPEKHINEMLKSHGSFSLHGEDRVMTVMFADIRNFTAISESMSAADLVDMLNLYFTPMTEIIHKYIGTVDKYIGDLIMAFWGAPMNDGDHAFHAIQAALQMQSQLDQLRRLQATKKWPQIIMGIGINSGRMSVGDMGSRFRRNYTVLGDAVNLASRVESLTRYYDVNILVTENTFRDQTKFIFRKIDRVQVKGKKTGVDIYEVLGMQSQATTQTIQELEIYHKGLQLYSQRKWQEALIPFNQLAQQQPNKKLFKIYIERLTEYCKTPPPEDWDGIYIHQEK